MKTTDSSTAPDGSAWRPKKLSMREERRRAERDARKHAREAKKTEPDAAPQEGIPDESPEP